MRILSAAVMFLVIGATSVQAEGPDRWARIQYPSPDAPQAIGTPAAGCLAGGQPLPESGPGWQVLRLDRQRYFAHPDTIDFVEWLGQQAQAAQLGDVLLGDLSQPRGGPMSFGHGSHQNGLDVDIMLQLSDHPLTVAERSYPIMHSVVQGRDVDPRRWSDKFLDLLHMAAMADKVERIFVNPAIKAHLCRVLPPQQRAWLHKLRPWWGHDEHFHVRLACPPDSPNCKPQAPPPDGDGCGAEVDSWLDRPTLNIPSDKPNTRNVTLPAECAQVLKRKGGG